MVGTTSVFVATSLRGALLASLVTGSEVLGFTTVRSRASIENGAVVNGMEVTGNELVGSVTKGIIGAASWGPIESTNALVTVVEAVFGDDNRLDFEEEEAVKGVGMPVRTTGAALTVETTDDGSVSIADGIDVFETSAKIEGGSICTTDK